LQSGKPDHRISLAQRDKVWFCPLRRVWLDPRLREDDGAQETLIYSVLSFPRRREPSKIKTLDPRFCGDDE
jgi:hypothetical protein